MIVDETAPQEAETNDRLMMATDFRNDDVEEYDELDLNAYLGEERDPYDYEERPERSYSHETDPQGREESTTLGMHIADEWENDDRESISAVNNAPIIDTSPEKEMDAEAMYMRAQSQWFPPNATELHLSHLKSPLSRSDSFSAKAANAGYVSQFMTRNAVDTLPAAPPAVSPVIASQHFLVPNGRTTNTIVFGAKPASAAQSREGKNSQLFNRLYGEAAKAKQRQEQLKKKIAADHQQAIHSTTFRYALALSPLVPLS